MSKKHRELDDDFDTEKPKVTVDVEEFENEEENEESIDEEKLENEYCDWFMEMTRQMTEYIDDNQLPIFLTRENLCFF